MPIYAIDTFGKIFSAHDTPPPGLYRCLECQAPLKRRSSGTRSAYFYHLSASSSCRLSTNSSAHADLQKDLQAKIPELIMERPFPSILRIADLCWEEKKLIFEIQCSPISLDQAASRISDYAKEGYEVVWLLDDRLYNKRKLGAAEQLLRKNACYFFYQNLIYDQLELVLEKTRSSKGPKLPVDLSRPNQVPLPQKLPKQFQTRTSHLIFEGDLLHRLTTYPLYLKSLLDFEAEALLVPQPKIQLLTWIKKSFWIAWEYILSSACK
jgi:competence protein CoiA